MRPLSEATSRVVSQNCSKKYIALGRIVSQWADIMGSEFADKAQPIKLNYRKKEQGKSPKAVLDVATTSAHATILSYQKGLILERINRIFGDQWITDIRFFSIPASQELPLRKKAPAPLTGAEEQYLSDLMNLVEDQDMKVKLEQLGKAILTEVKS